MSEGKINAYPDWQIQHMPRWREKPYDFAVEVLGICSANGFTISNQQKEALERVGEIAVAKEICWNYDKKIWDDKPTKRQRELSQKFGLSIMAGKGVGKDTTAAILILWFLSLYTNARIPCIGPGGEQMRKVLWPEISKWYNMKNARGEYIMMSPFRDFLTFEAEKIFYNSVDSKKGERPGSKWFAFMRAIAKSADESSMANAIGGQHEDNMMIIADEAAGVPNPVFEPLENTLTGKINFAVLIWNPNRTSGFAYDTHYSPKVKHLWEHLHWDAEKSDLVSADHIKRMKNKFGEDSNSYQVYVKGLPPSSGGDSLIPMEWVRNAEDRYEILKPDNSFNVKMGVDVARYGNDSTVFVIRQGPLVLKIEKFDKLDTTEVAEAILKSAHIHEVDEIFIDAIGIGAGVYDMVKKYHHGARGIEVSRNARQKDKYHRLRDEIWWNLRCRFEEGRIAIPFNEDMSDQLCAIKYDPLKVMGKIKIEGKDQLKKRLGGDSPDYGDALGLAFYDNDYVVRDRWSAYRLTQAPSAGDKNGSHGWMSL